MDRYRSTKRRNTWASCGIRIATCATKAAPALELGKYILFRPMATGDPSALFYSLTGKSIFFSRTPTSTIYVARKVEIGVSSIYIACGWEQESGLENAAQTDWSLRRSQQPLRCNLVLGERTFHPTLSFSPRGVAHTLAPSRTARTQGSAATRPFRRRRRWWHTATSMRRRRASRPGGWKR